MESNDSSLLYAISCIAFIVAAILRSPCCACFLTLSETDALRSELSLTVICDMLIVLIDETVCSVDVDKSRILPAVSRVARAISSIELEVSITKLEY